jgi:hypothetical protein
VHAFHGLKRRLRAQGTLLQQFVRKHVQQHFRIGLGVDVPVILLGNFTAQGFGIGQIAVMRQ